MRFKGPIPVALSLILIASGYALEVAAQTPRHSFPRGQFRTDRPPAQVRTEKIKDATEVLFDSLAPWVFVEYKRFEGRPTGRFLNTTTRQKTDWLRPGAFLEGARIASLDADRARLTYRSARQDLLFVPEKPPKYDPNRKRTPEEIADAQRRYSEFYMKKFIVSGKEYARLRGNPTAPQHQWYPKP